MASSPNGKKRCLIKKEKKYFHQIETKIQGRDPDVTVRARLLALPHCSGAPVTPRALPMAVPPPRMRSSFLANGALSLAACCAVCEQRPASHFHEAASSSTRHRYYFTCNRDYHDGLQNLKESGGMSETDATASAMDAGLIDSGGETKSALTTWRYRHHFTYKADQGKNIIVQCNLCLPRVNLLSTSKTSTSNLKKHLDVSRGEPLSRFSWCLLSLRTMAEKILLWVAISRYAEMPT